MTPATEFRAALDGLNLKQRHLARLFGVGPREIRRWKSGARRLPRGVGLVVQLLSAGAVTVAQIEEAAARTNGSADPKPPEQPAPVELTVAQKLLRLKSGACKWPSGDPSGDPAGFAFACRSPALIGKPYCEHHYAIATLSRPRTPFRLRAPKSCPVFPVRPDPEPVPVPEVESFDREDAGLVDCVRTRHAVPMELVE
jgi:hypothetical protein